MLAVADPVNVAAKLCRPQNENDDNRNAFQTNKELDTPTGDTALISRRKWNERSSAGRSPPALVSYPPSDGKPIFG
jgi:hypothetical protein